MPHQLSAYVFVIGRKLNMGPFQRSQRGPEGPHRWRRGEQFFRPALLSIPRSSGQAGHLRVFRPNATEL